MDLDLWNAMLDADMNARCWSSMTRIYARIDLWTRIFLGVTTSGAVAGWAIWSKSPGVWKTLSAASAVMAIASPIFNLPKSIRGLSDMAGKWQVLLSEYEELWRNEKALESKAARKRFDELKRAEAKQKSNETGLPVFNWVHMSSARAVRRSRGLR